MDESPRPKSGGCRCPGFLWPLRSREQSAEILGLAVLLDNFLDGRRVREKSLRESVLEWRREP